MQYKKCCKLVHTNFQNGGKIQIFDSKTALALKRAKKGKTKLGMVDPLVH
jgi:hypothetical protein